MAEQTIPAEMLDAATDAVIRQRRSSDRAEAFAKAALEAANVAALLARIAELEKQLAQDQADLALLGAEQLGGSSLKLTMAIYDKWVKEQGDKMLRTRITELEAELAKHQESPFHPDWSVLEATRESLREAWAKLKEMEQTAADALKEAE